MKVETFSDVLDWTRAVHRNLADCAAHCGAGSRHEKVRMLLDYVHEHETRLNRILESSQKDADPAALNSWAYEFFEKVENGDMNWIIPKFLAFAGHTCI